MPQIATILTLVAMLWHAVAGCCAHHSHAPAFWGDQTETEVARSHGCHHHQHSAPDTAGDSQHRHDHSDPGECQHVDCVFSAASPDGHLTLSKLIGSQLYFDSSSLVSLDGSLDIVDDGRVLRSTPKSHLRPPVYIQFQSLLI